MIEKRRERQPLIASEHMDPQSLAPSYKSVPVRITRPAGIEEVQRTVGRADALDQLAAMEL